MVGKIGSLGGGLVGVGAEPESKTPSAVRSAASELGRPVMRYTRPFADRALRRLLIACLLELAAVLILAGPDNLLRAPLAGALLVIGLALVVRTVFVRPLDLRVHAYGFILSSGRGSQVAASYSSIDSIRARGLESGKTLEVMLTLGDGRSVRIASSDLPFRAAAEAILAHARAVVAPRVAADFLAGVDLDFGRVQVRDHKLFAGDREVLLSDIESATIQKQHLVVVLGGGGASVRVPSFEVANLEALLSLLSRVASGPKHRPSRPAARRGDRS